VPDILGAINYLAAAIIVMREKEAFYELKQSIQNFTGRKWFSHR
jgi:hypothetical protein